MALIAAVSAATGWSFGDAAHEAPADAATAEGHRGSELAAAVPAAWSGYAAGPEDTRELGLLAADGMEPGDATCEFPGGNRDAVDLETLEMMLTQGNETQRYDAIMSALEAAAELPPDLLWQAYQYGASESLRLLAFETYADAKASAPEELRTALQAGVVDVSPALRAEAQHRLGELDAYELLRSQVPPQDPR